jgi:hypothetical protein
MVLGASHQQALYSLAGAAHVSAGYARWLQETGRQPSPPLTSQITLHTLHVPGWKLLRSLDLSAVHDGQCWVVSDDILGIYGVGDEPAEALRDYEATLVHFYTDIVEWQGGLAPHLEQRRALLQAYLEREES